MRTPQIYTVISSMKRVVMEPEPVVDPELLAAMNHQHEIDDANDELARKRHYRTMCIVQVERDPPMRDESSQRVDRLMMLAATQTRRTA